MNNSAYKKELKKVMFLLLMGMIFAYIYSTRNSDKVYMIALMFYPLGIAYGWREMWKLYTGIRSGDKPNGNCGSTTIAITVLNIAIAFSMTICFGWLFGVYKAVKLLKQLKTNQ